MIHIDASQGEGGGQILRTSLALSMCTGQPVTLEKIRAKRSKPGLLRQHLTCVNAAAEVSSARVLGAELGASTLVFEPGEVRAGDYRFAVGSAGSCTLVLQTVWPALLLAGQSSRLTLCGGTHNPMAPPFHFIERCFLPLLRRLGAGGELSLRRHGFYPAGGGEFEAVLQPAAAGLVPFDLLERGAPGTPYAEVLAAALPRGVATRELEVLAQGLGWSGPQLRVAGVRSDEGPGNALMATLEHAEVCELFTAFGEKGVSAEQVGRSLVAEVSAYQAGQGALGPHLADQWALPLALAVWRSGRAAAYTCTELTEHAHTNFRMIEHFLPVRFETRVQGAGWWVGVS